MDLLPHSEIFNPPIFLSGLIVLLCKTLQQNIDQVKKVVTYLIAFHKIVKFKLYFSCGLIYYLLEYFSKNISINLNKFFIQKGI